MHIKHENTKIENLESWLIKIWKFIERVYDRPGRWSRHLMCCQLQRLQPEKVHFEVKRLQVLLTVHIDF